MRRLAATLACDLRIQYRYGYPLAAACLALPWILVPALVPGATPDRLLPVFIVCNLLVNAFYFTAGLALLEKAEGTLAMRAASPLRPHEYLASKAATLGLLSLPATLAMVLLLRGPAFQPVLLLAGTAAACILLVFAGFIAASLAPTVPGFLLSSLLWVPAFLPPLLPGFGLADSPLLRIHPLDPPLALLRASFSGGGAGEIAYGLAGSAAWALVGLRGCKSAFERLRQAGE